MSVKSVSVFSDVYRIFYNLINNNISDPSSRSVQWIFSCVDEATECLTKEGWKSISTLKSTDYIYTYSGKFEKINKINKYDNINTELIKVETRDLSMRLTPNHRVLGWQRSSTKRVYPKIIKASNMVNNICIPQITNCITEGNCRWSDEFIQLIGWIITEGHIRKEKNHGITIYQSQNANPEKVNMIRTILNSLNFDYTESHRKRFITKIMNTICNIPSEEVAFYIKNKDTTKIKQVIPNKKLTFKLILNLNKRQRRLLIETMILGDGNKKGENQFCYIQKSKEDIDMFAMLAVLADYRVAIKKKKGEDIYVAYLTSKSYTCIRKKNKQYIEHERYNGTVWCPSVNSGTFLARRKGKVFYTGNSYPEQDLAENKLKYPVIIIEPVDASSWTRLTMDKTTMPLSISISAYSTRMIQADELLCQIASVIDSNRATLKWDEGLHFLNLQDTTTDFDLRGGTRAHVRSATYTFDYIFKDGLSKETASKTINSAGEIA
jgi:hypothetical protein